MDIELFKRISRLPFIWKQSPIDSYRLPQNRTCIKCTKLECVDRGQYKDNEFTCYKGFNNYLLSLKGEKVVLNGLIYLDNKVVKQGTKNARKEHFISKDEVKAFVSEIAAISNCVDEGIRSNIKERFSLFHDVRSSYAIAFSNIEKIILAASGSSFLDKLQNSQQGIIDLYDSLDLVNSQLELIDVMVNPAAISQGSKKNINFFKLIDKLRKLFTPKAEKRDLMILMQSDHHIPDGHYHDSIKLIPIILIENAIKYSEVHNKIFVTFGKESTTGKVNFLISSYGRVVPIDERTKIFDKHVRGSNTEFYDMEGIGMGLYIARNILREHNGTISYSVEEKKQGYGFNKFTVEL
jgi:K+-sensing histidine kinase KdpD